MATAHSLSSSAGSGELVYWPMMLPVRNGAVSSMARKRWLMGRFAAAADAVGCGESQPANRTSALQNARPHLRQDARDMSTSTDDENFRERQHGVVGHERRGKNANRD